MKIIEKRSIDKKLTVKANVDIGNEITCNKKLNKAIKITVSFKENEAVKFIQFCTRQYPDIYTYNNTSFALKSFSKEDVKSLTEIAPDFHKNNPKLFTEKADYKKILFTKDQLLNLKKELNEKNARTLSEKLVDKEGKLQWDKIKDFYMIDSENPKWKLDIVPKPPKNISEFMLKYYPKGNNSIYYEELGASLKTKNLISIYDQPGPNPLQERFVACTFITVNDKVKYLVKWSIQHAEKIFALQDFSKEEIKHLDKMAPNFYRKNNESFSQKLDYKNILFDEKQLFQLKKELKESKNKQGKILSSKLIENNEFYQVEIENRKNLPQWAWKLLNDKKYIDLLKNSSGQDVLKNNQPFLTKNFDLQKESQNDFLKPPQNWFTCNKYPELFSENKKELKVNPESTVKLKF